ncbi:hypothetical protein O6H91_04G109000 [Diphasiastrum complanatum]|uniref:Uncharacterized protein n=1 Tax=Diphasiastrum complanatum TaxID=34168 RepID=A0ACC2E0I4_DIPCM|nr:hypothetical protein O6H91_04G109000 [Diphasiastrum complanatum]
MGTKEVGRMWKMRSSAEWKACEKAIRSSLDGLFTRNGMLQGLHAVIPPACAALTFELTLLLYQGTGRVIGVSCATPVLGPMLGCVAVASASVASAKVSEALIKSSCTNLKGDDTSYWSNHLFLHAVLGVIAFKALGGSCRSVMPSSVIHPGALARRSIPARGSRYANGLEADLVKDLYMEHGCHHCGSRRGKSIADHMPPNLLANGNINRRPTHHKAGIMAGAFEWIKCRLPSLNNLFFSQDKRQRFYPQCLSCMFNQSEALRHKKRILVFHFKWGFPEPPYLAGFCIGTFFPRQSCDESQEKTNRPCSHES